MLIRINEIAFDIDLLEKCRSELCKIDDRNVFFDNLVRKRLDKCRQYQIDKFELILEDIISSARSNNFDIDDISRIIDQISRTSIRLQRTNIEMLKKISKEEKIDNENT